MPAGPRITITCECGEARLLAYGEAYACRCGRRWSTAQIPAVEYEAVRRVDRRYRALGWAFGLGFSLFILLAMRTLPGLMMAVIPITMLGWFGFLRPIVRGQHRRDVQALMRTWTLRPEEPYR